MADASKCKIPLVEIDKKRVGQAADSLEKLFSLCDKTDQPENIVSCYPKVENIVSGLQSLMEVMIPGKFSPRPEDTVDINRFLRRLIGFSWEALQPEIEKAIPFRWFGADSEKEFDDKQDFHQLAVGVMGDFLVKLPEIRQNLIEDIRAAYNGDPAMLSYAEVKLASPGIAAIVSHRIAHEFYRLEVPLVPRIMAEWTHMQTGIDIHPGAQIGKGFFIDHGTGVVIGETAEIGENVKLYQGVTIGAKSFPLDENGNPIKHIKRHPTIERDVVVYSNATILGGETVIGAGSTVAGNVFLMKSVPANSFVSADPGDLKIKEAR